MTCVRCSIPEQFANPLFEVFDGGDFVLSSYRDIEEPTTSMRIFFEDRACAGEAERRLRAAMEIVGVAAPVEVVELADEDWKFAYRRHFKTEAIGSRLVTVPEWEVASFASSALAKGGRLPIVLDPGLAFGTGKHETTRACLEYVDELAPSSPAVAASLLDMGCGSGILSIAAAKLGYRPVAGFDIDEEAVAASRENAARNGVDVDYRVFALGRGAVTLEASIEAAKGVYPDLALQGRAAGSRESFAPADLVVANILGPLLIAFADEIAGYVKRDLVVSGILCELYPEVADAFSSRGFAEISHKFLGEWATGLFRRSERIPLE